MASFHVVALLSAYLLVLYSLLASGDLCSEAPCQNGGSCRGDNTTFVCHCAGCFIGTYCEFDPCTEFSDFCENDGICQYDSQTCETACHCKNGTTGHSCDENDPCADAPCRNGGTCNTVNGTHFHCKCPTCYGGQLCDADPCLSDGETCNDHGHCIFNVNGICQNVACECDNGWGGNFCDDQVSTIATTMQTGSTTVLSTTTTLDPCSMYNCQHNGTCVADGSSYTCKCVTPYAGINCENAMCYPDPKIILTANGTWQTLSTTRYPLYINGLNCLWTIRAPPGQTVEIVVSNVTLVGSTIGTFAVLDPLANNASLFSTQETNRTTNDVKTSNTLASIFFDTHANSSGNFFLQYRSVYTDPCAGYSCGSNGTCIANGNAPECHCNPCYSGAKCDIPKKDPCANSVCGAHGTCAYDQATCSNPYCNCNGGYTGPFCSNPPLP
uniref:EGF-like domain-containing protein n=1 Tax=Plectus sambesii TaxID=2011161 RepID=A0A914X5M0_9BILA